jgi:hypothetical protein
MSLCLSKKKLDDFSFKMKVEMKGVSRYYFAMVVIYSNIYLITDIIY